MSTAEHATGSLEACMPCRLPIGMDVRCLKLALFT